MLDALCFDGRSHSFAAVTADDLAFADRTQLTLLLAPFDLPPAARAHVDSALARNTIRMRRIAEVYQEFAGAFDHVELKGRTHAPDFVDDPSLRVQYDLDLYTPPDQRETARDALLALGYLPIGGQEQLAMDHLPTMVRKTGWQWRGDYFDPELPPAVEVHFQFWDAATERLRVEGLNEFWARREGNRLSLIDTLGYASLHLTRHLLRGNPRPFHVWELARFLHHQHDAGFWRAWRQCHSASLRRLEAVAFLMARHWFACSLADQAEDEVAALPSDVHRWFEVYGWSPLEALFQPNKHELWLHLSLLNSPADRYEVLRRRLFPLSLPGPVDAIHIPAHEMTPGRRMKSYLRNGAYAVSRGWRHARLLIPTVWEGLKWRLRSRQ